VTIEQRIAQQLADSLTDAEFDTLSAEADADAKLCRCGAPLAEHRYGPCRPDHDEVPFRDGGDVPAAQPAIPLDHDGRGPRVDTRRDDYQSLFGLKTGRHSHPATHPLWMVFTDSNCVVCA
jgi:hypothetical protein